MTVAPAPAPAPPVAQGSTVEFDGETLGQGEAYLAFRADEIAAKRGTAGFAAFTAAFESEVRDRKQRLADNDKKADPDASGAPLSGGTLDAAKTYASVGEEVVAGLKARSARLRREEGEFLGVF